MSRHHVQMSRSHEAIVGWDRPMQSFFAQIIDRHTDDLVGYADDVLTIDALVVAVRTLTGRLHIAFELPVELVAAMQSEQAGERDPNIIRHWPATDPHRN